MRSPVLRIRLTLLCIQFVSVTHRSFKSLLGAYLEDPGLLLEVLVLVGLCVRKVVNLDPVFVDLIQNLHQRATHVSLRSSSPTEQDLCGGTAQAGRLIRDRHYSCSLQRGSIQEELIRGVD